MSRGLAVCHLFLLVVVACGDNTNQPTPIEVSVHGLAGTGLVLQNNGADDLAIDHDGTFTFTTPLEIGDGYAVTVASQPESPTQSCVVANGAGRVASSQRIAIDVTCTIARLTVGGTVSGLTGSGLVLQNNAGDDLEVAADGSFTFATPIASGAAFDVTVKTQPTGPHQTCTVTNGSGTIAADPVTSVVVACEVDTFAVGGTVTGLVGTVVLQNNLGDALTVSANGSFTFATPVASGEPYSITVLTQPTSPTQTCVVTNGTGTVVDADVTTAVVTCTTNTYTIGGTVSGLAGAGLVLQNNSGDDLAISSDGMFTFTTPVMSGATFAVTVLTQPTNPWQTCTVTGASGAVVSSNVMTVMVDCTANRYAIGGTVSGLDGTGLQLALNNGTPLAIGANGSFAFPTTLASGTAYTVTITGQPHTNWQTCTVASESGTVGGADVTDVAVTCVTNTYAVGGTVTGLAGTGLTLRNGGEDLAVAADGSFAFTTKIASGDSYTVSVAAQPTDPWQTCTVTAGSGVVGGGDVTSVAVTCTTNTYTIGGTISGLADTVVLQNNLGDNLVLDANGAFVFSAPVASGDAYTVTVLTQPASPSQTCTVTAGSGTVTNSDVTGISIACVVNTFSIGGTVTGLEGSGLVLRDNGGDDLPISADGSFAFATEIASGQPFAVTVSAQPSGPAQTCVVSGDTGTVGGADVTSVVVNCTTNRYLVGGSVSGLGTATGLVLVNNGGDDVSVTADGTFSFATSVASGDGYDVTVKTQPTAPWLTCDVANGTGSIDSTDVADVQVTCTPNPYAVKVAVTGLTGSGLVLQNNGGDDLPISGDGTFAFATPIASGSPYSVTVLSNPTSPWQTCTVAAPSGTMADGVTVAVSCVTNEYGIDLTVEGLVGSGLVVQNNGGDDLPIASSGVYAFPTQVASGTTYAVTVLTQPSGQTCVVVNGTGTVGGATVTVTVACDPHDDGFGHPWYDGVTPGTYGAAQGIAACQTWSTALGIDPTTCTSAGCSCNGTDLCAYNTTTPAQGQPRYVWFYSGSIAGQVTANCCGCTAAGLWE